MQPLHRPVLTHEVIEIFSGCSLNFFFDGTLGAGGHALALLNAHPEIELYIGCDQDPSALLLAEEKLQPWKERTVFIHSNFIDLRSLCKSLEIMEVQGILLDLGVSSMQIDNPERGFSFSYEGPLDMRMDPTQDLTVEEIVNSWSEEKLAKIFREYGEEPRWRKAAQVIVQARCKEPLKTTKQLVDLLYPYLKNPRSKIHPLTLIFQGLRIALNQELSVLENILPQAIDLLAPGGRLAVISFHSLEDRLVKQAMQYAASDKENTAGIGGLFLEKAPQVKLLTKRPIVPTEEEVNENPRSRSAKLRAVEKLHAL